MLDANEKDLSLYAFRFKYEASIPTCPGNSTGTQGTWIVYSGASFRSAYFPTDFALAELNGAIMKTIKVAQNRIEIDMSHYLPGVYLIHFKSKNQLITQKIIKQ